MHRSINVLLILLVCQASACRSIVPQSPQFSDAELQSCKHKAITAINDPDVWNRFPTKPHERHYIPLPRQIGFVFDRNDPSSVTVIVPTTKVAFHSYYVAVKFDHLGKITGIDESFHP